MTTTANASIDAVRATIDDFQRTDYGPMFTELQRPPAELTPRRIGELRDMAVEMLPTDHESDEDPEDGGGSIPAGYTYVGQLVAHDVTFFLADVGEEDYRQVRNGRTPSLDLDCVYGGNPRTSPYLYQRGRSASLLLGGSADPRLTEHHRPVGRDLDLPRNHQGRALIPDPRNDHNTMVSQLHLSLMLCHNRLVAEARGRGLDERDAFVAARTELTHSFQWFVLHEYLEHVLEEARREWLATALAAKAHGHRIGVKHFKPWERAWVPLEFSLAAQRFGHSMVRAGYQLNEDTRVFPLTPLGGWEGAPFDSHLCAQDHLPNGWTIDWDLFLPGPDGTDGGSNLQRARRIDPNLTRHLGNVPHPAGPGHGPFLLPFSTLVWGERTGLPFGEELATHLDEDPLHGKDTPLWPWILEEARTRQDGRRLGPVGSTIVAEVLLALVDADPRSYLNANPRFRPRWSCLKELLNHGRDGSGA